MESQPQFMRALSVKEAAEILDVPPGTVRQWERSLEGILKIPRDQNGNRYYTDFEIHTLTLIKEMREKNMGFEAIKEIVQAMDHSNGETASTTSVHPIPIMSQNQAIETIHSLQLAVEELTKKVDRIIVEQVRNEVSNASKVISDQIESLSEQMRKQQEQVHEILELSRVEKYKKKSWLDRLLGR